ncbi:MULTISPECIES: nucleoside 2-deoxyribosyltransferase [unclassified Mesorhizobium]|uniref:nucleoside 2-deoxyribosyltransferase n=2 Tax=Mesorhizobium TaxID=68287 RepID=UPI0019D28FB0|nr:MULTISPECIES: nucleoside 2-deoxyribosyltransferase [unclassified Mesorhizobium]MCT2580709.1 nucleoside 2-deoxyribosyltransferase [Mesorhizobium sp. P13.3]MDF3169651.1 nucleoside 2-deoxyribosyltransferase [Mesorhizobium sp. P16.1]MDF3179497.1 nucleoside 2-deoxyribosyltransferase [Mesorhizobium sp. P17.1]MDF3186566.1 nucleoside 2-deoxyribosyltransferase [Mesorhizobium sp. ICCV3110.1]
MAPLLLVGEIIVDFTTARPGVECKLRLGGIVHAARGLWASGIDYAVAAVCPRYVVDQAKRYLSAHGCLEFVWLGEVTGSPGVMVIGDPTEVADQGYEDLLRGEKAVTILDVGNSLAAYHEVLIFPGSFDLAQVRSAFSDDARFSFDIAYDTADPSVLKVFSGNVKGIAISTSSQLFMRVGSETVDAMLPLIEDLGAEVFLLKENRGGSRLFNLSKGSVDAIPAQLSVTVNSVGVGDVYTAVMVGLSRAGWGDAAWRGASAATAYSQTTYPDDFRRDVERSLKLSVDELRNLGGTILPWHARPLFPIYLAAPDFSYTDKPEVDRAVDALKYHNFNVRRPIEENGELPLGSPDAVLRQTFAKDLGILGECEVVFAVPLDRDPGTLVEMGFAMARQQPVITFDPRRENNNTMVAGGSARYSDNLDQCLNGIFDAVSKLWMAKS